ncbi:MAG: tRNA epoxyqueuosine(34) reductase QueG [Candidatus Eisenbacteria sp.]|nr:tRNA epoxyqueuosine(34) reductase QueG [Candidatus Eisenbacteria bacterium]
MGAEAKAPIPKSELVVDSPAAARLKLRLGEAAARLGFDRWGCADPGSLPSLEPLQAWLARGEHAGMGYMARHADLRGDPHRFFPGVRTIFCVALNYSPAGMGGRDREPGAPLRVARYAWGADYHDILRGKLHRLLQQVKRWVSGARGRVAVDTAPVLERHWAAQAGIGWIGRNTCLIVPRLGSYVFLGELLLDIPLPPDQPLPRRCGTCRQCLVACPSGALAEPYRLDARRCIAYWTVEHRGAFPASGAPRISPWLFGCDRCQEACPWNRFAVATREPAFHAPVGRQITEPGVIATLDTDTFGERFGGTPLTRAGFEGLERNWARICGENAAGSS